MNITTNTIEDFGILAGIFDKLDIGEIIDPALPKTRHHKAGHTAIVNCHNLKDAACDYAKSCVALEL
ncbi:MAG: DUF4277 domain-containing protein [Methanothrix sp.]|nr:MAG: DUF4277 domain-containing protein [Methanothrix sp.]